MSFDPVMSNYVNGSFIIWHLVDIVAKGGSEPPSHHTLTSRCHAVYGACGTAHTVL
jgi:hypothetical protein